MKIPFTNYHIIITIIPDKYYIKPIKNQLARYMLQGYIVKAVRLLKEYGKENNYDWSLREAKDFVEANFKYIPHE